MLKKAYYLAFLFIAVLSFSCSSDDETTHNETATPASIYFPLNPNSYWTYSNVSDQGNTSDSLYVSGTQNQNGATYTNLDARIPAIAFMVNLLSQNLVRSNSTEFLLFGELSTPPVEGFPEISIPLDNVVLFDTELPLNSVLSNFNGEIEELINEIPIVIEYTVRTEQKESLESYSVNGHVFNDVKKSLIVVTLAITAEIEVLPGVILPVPILSTQEVLIVSNFFAANVGLISSEALTQYELEDLSGTGIDLPFPTEASTTSTQSIDQFLIGN
jgi:hypothetical protein